MGLGGKQTDGGDLTVSRAFDAILNRDQDSGGEQSASPTKLGKANDPKDKKQKKLISAVEQSFWDERSKQVLSEMQFDIKKEIAEEKAKRKAYLASEIIGKWRI